MKLLLVLAIVLVCLWLWRNNRRTDAADRDQQRQQPSAQPPRQAQAASLKPTEMVACQVCQVHLPRLDALPGTDGAYYCCAGHRQQAGGQS